MTATWLGTSADAQVSSELVPPGYNILQVARPDKQAGGVAVLLRDGLGVKMINHKGDVFTHFGHMDSSVKAGKTEVRLFELSSNDFYKEWFQHHQCL